MDELLKTLFKYCIEQPNCKTCQLCNVCGKQIQEWF